MKNFKREELIQEITAGNTDRIKELLRDMHPADVAEDFARLEIDQLASVLQTLSPDDCSNIFEFLPSEMQKAVLPSLQKNYVAELISVMSPDDRADLVEELDHRIGGGHGAARIDQRPNLIDDDTVIEAEWVVHKAVRTTGWGLSARRIESSEARGAWAFDPVIRTPADLKTVYGLLMKEIGRLRGGEFTDEEMETGRVMALVAGPYGRQTVNNVAQGMSLAELYGVGYDFEERFDEALKQVTREDIMRVLNRYLGKMQVAVTGPAGVGEIVKELEAAHTR